MVSEPAISVLIPVRNGEAFIASAIESVLRQTVPYWELIISDNASTDSTHAVVERYLSDHRIRLVANTENLGMTGNFNRCLDEVRTKYYMLLCHDDFLYVPNALETAYAVMEENPDIPAAYCDLMFVNAVESPLAQRTYKRQGRIDSNVLARRSILQTRNLFGIPILVRTSALAGLRYDPALSFALDLDLSIGIAAGRQIYHIPEILIGNRYHGANQTGMLLATLFDEMVYIAAKNGFALNAYSRAIMRASNCAANFTRQAFLWYANRRRTPDWQRTAISRPTTPPP